MSAMVAFVLPLVGGLSGDALTLNGGNPAQGQLWERIAEASNASEPQGVSL